MSDKVFTTAVTDELVQNKGGKIDILSSFPREESEWLGNNCENFRVLFAETLFPSTCEVQKYFPPLADKLSRKQR